MALLVAVVGVLPFFSALRDSFFHEAGGARTFIGLDNYEYLLSDRALFLSAGITCLWAVLEAALVTAAAWSLALLLFESRRGFGLFYAALLVPWGVPTYISLPLWRMIIHGAGGESMLTALFGLRINLLTDPAASFAASLFVGLWMGLPGAVFILYGALRKLPRRSIEAARLDGAGRAGLSRLIYLPLARSSLIVVFAFEFVKAFKEFQIPFLLTGGGPPLVSGITERTVVGATTTLEIYLYDLFQGADDYGLAAAYAAAAALFIAVLTGLAFLPGRLARGAAGRPRSGGRIRTGFVSHNALADSAVLGGRLVLGSLVLASSLLLGYALLRSAFSGLSSAYVDSFLPRYPTARAFADIFIEDGIARPFANTLVLAALTAAITPLIVFPAALRMRSAGPGARAALFAFLQALGSAGGMHSLVPLYALFRQLGLADSYVPVVLVYVFHAAPPALFAATAFLDDLPASMEESAVLEGAGRAQVFFRIVLPLSLPVLATSAMTAFIAAWNGFLAPLLFLNDDAKYTIGMRLYGYVGSVASGAPKWNRFAAASIVNLAIVGLALWRLKGPLARAPSSECEE
jgi:ABC-type glycerol-3-phosphate transport system permease component